MRNLIIKISDELRGKVDASEFKDYIFTFIKLRIEGNYDYEDFKQDTTFVETKKISIDNFTKIKELIGEINFDETDVLGNIYEILMKEFSAKNKGGEFYTPKSVTKLLSKLTDKKGVYYDPTAGSGGMLIANKDKATKFLGQELNEKTFNLLKLNMKLSGIDYEIFQGDTLEDDQVKESADVIVANPPYSLNWNPDKLQNDDRFKDYGKTAPKTKADFAFIQHSLFHLKEDGQALIVLPHGVLFRGASESVIRQYILEKNWLDAVIGLPANIFMNTSIPTVVLSFKKNRQNKDILFIDASKEFEKGKNQNDLSDDHITKIVETYKDRKNIDKFSHIVTLDEIKDNDFNLNIPRYVDTYEEEEPIDVFELSDKILETNQKIKELNKAILDDLNDLVGSDEQTSKELQELKKSFGE